jgi:septum formation protein
MFRVYLASASPRRAQLLDQIGVGCDILPVDLDESRLPAEAPREYVQRLAVAKARTLWTRLKQDRQPVLGADTTVVLADSIFGKPSDREEGIAMLRRLSGVTHDVFTAVALQSRQGCYARLSVSQVTFRTLSDEDCVAYWETGEPLGKAGGYAVQGLAAVFIKRIEGSYSGIMGLPLAETAELLSLAGWSLKENQSSTSEPRQ